MTKAHLISLHRLEHRRDLGVGPSRPQQPNDPSRIAVVFVDGKRKRTADPDRVPGPIQQLAQSRSPVSSHQHSNSSSVRRSPRRGICTKANRAGTSPKQHSIQAHTTSGRSEYRCSTNRAVAGVVIVVRIVCGLFAVLSVLLWRAVARLGVEAGADGIGLRRWFGTRYEFVPWSDIKTFRMVRSAAIYPTVCAELSSGEFVKTDLVQGRKMRWRGGASRDMVGVLNSNLARARPR